MSRWDMSTAFVIHLNLNNDHCAGTQAVHVLYIANNNVFVDVVTLQPHFVNY